MRFLLPFGDWLRSLFTISRRLPGVGLFVACLLVYPAILEGVSTSLS